MIALRQKSKANDLDHRDIGQLPALVLMTGILLLAFAFGAHGLNRDPIWVDELASLSYMGAFDPPFGLDEVLTELIQYSPPDVPLFFVLGSVWGELAGWNQLSMRFMAVAAGVLTIAWLYRFAADVLNARTGLVAACFMSTTSYVVIYFHELRPYSLFMMITIAHCWLYFRLACRRSPTKRLWWIAFVASTCVLFFVHNFAGLVVGALAATHLLWAPKTKRRMQIVAAWGIGILSFVPYMSIMIAGFFIHRDNVRAIDSIELLNSLLKVYSNGAEFLLAPLVLAVCYALWKTRSGTAARILIILLLMVGTLLIANSIFEFIPITRLRYFIMIWFLPATLISFGLTSLPHYRIPTVLTLVAWIVAGFFFGRSSEILDYAGLQAIVPQYPPLHKYVYHLESLTKHGDYVIGFDPSGSVNKVPIFTWHSISDYYLKAQLGIDGYFLHSHLKRYRLERDVRDILTAHPQVLLAYDPSDEPRNYARTFEIIAADYIPCSVLVDNPDLHIQRYTHPVLGCDNEATTIDYENGITVLDYAARFDAENERLQVLTWWELPDEDMLDQFNISLQIITTDWQNQRQVDRHLYDNITPWSVIELSTQDLPAGEYRLMLILYERDSLDKVNGQSLPNGDYTNMHTLLTFSIGDR